MTDIDIAQSANIQPISHIASRLGIPEDALIPYGKYKAKVDPAFAHDHPARAKVVLVTAINPTPAGEGKTTTSVGLCDALNAIGQSAILALREPSLGPVFGMKGGAAGGGYAQVIPMEDINLHFTGDLHAITAANNLLAAMIDNHIFQGNSLNIDPRQVTWRRCMDMNDRQLRNIIGGLNGKTNGTPREDGFDITAASEIMAVFCLASDLADLKMRLSRMVVAYKFGGTPITANDLNAQGALTVLLKDAFHPNLVQTLEGNPAFIHGGPFANIAHGTNSAQATLLAKKLADYVVTEAGFGADLGAEKYVDIVSRSQPDMAPDCAVIVATARALKCHGGMSKDSASEKNTDALNRGLDNLFRHAENLVTIWHLPCVVALNAFESDHAEEHAVILNACKERGIRAELCTVWRNGGTGGEALARAVMDLCTAASPPKLTPTYFGEATLEEKIDAVCRRVYRAGAVEYAAGVRARLKKIAALGYASLPVCIAKTQYSFTDDAKRIGAPEEFTLTVRDLRLSAGAGFVVVFLGDIIAMPGLPKNPAAQSIDIDFHGRITGLF